MVVESSKYPLSRFNIASWSASVLPVELDLCISLVTVDFPFVQSGKGTSPTVYHLLPEFISNRIGSRDVMCSLSSAQLVVILVLINERNSVQETKRRILPDELWMKLAAQLHNQLPAVCTRQHIQIGQRTPAFLPNQRWLTEVCMNTTMASSITKQHQDGSVEVENN
ncbi:hypothetical protein C5167_029019 [Papaver somniferum]|nr:hypothetical protein C5167_029019 [Papaver somniferum]